MAKELLLAGRRVIPEKALKSGFVFRYPQLRGALAAILGTSAPNQSEPRRPKAIPPCGMPGCDERPIRFAAASLDPLGPVISYAAMRQRPPVNGGKGEQPRGGRAPAATRRDGVVTNERAEADTFPKLLIQNAKRVRGARAAMRHKDLGIWQSWTWAQVLEEVRRSRSACRSLGSSAATSSPSSAPTGRGSTGRCAPARRSAPCRCRSMRTRSPTRWPMCSSTPRSRSRSWKIRSRSTRCCRSPIASRRCATWSMTSRAACATTTARKLSWIDDVQKVGREKLAADPARLAAWEASVAQGKGSRPRRHPLHLGHHRAAEGRDAHLRQHHHLGATTAICSTISTRTRKPSPICRSPGSAITCSPTRSTMSRASASIARRRARPWWRTAARSAPPMRSRRRASTRTC